MTIILFLALECYKCKSDEDPGCATANPSDIEKWDTEKCHGILPKCHIWTSK